jgi:hypothetical protein
MTKVMRINTVIVIYFIFFNFTSWSQVVDINGKRYSTINNRTWMSENLEVDKFRDGSKIPEAKSQSD